MREERSADDGTSADDLPAVAASPAESDSPADPAAPAAADSGGVAGPGSAGSPWRKLGGAGAMIGLLLALLGFTLVVQVKNNADDPYYQSLRQEDLSQILFDLQAQRNRLEQDVAELRAAKEELTAGQGTREAALAQAEERADQLGILAGILPAQGEGLTLTLEDAAGPITSNRLLILVQELRAAGAEAMQISSKDTAVRIINSTDFADAAGGLNVDGTFLSSPYTVTVIGHPTTMANALNLEKGAVYTIKNPQGKVGAANVIISDPGTVEVRAVVARPDLEYATPVP